MAPAKCRFMLLVLALLGGLPSSAKENSVGALAGWAEVEITPPLGIALGGRGGAETEAKKVLDPLYAQMLYLKDQKGMGFVLVSLDLVGLQHDLSERIRLALAGELGVEINLIVLNCSHTHSGPLMYRQLFAGIEPAPAVEVDYFNALTEKLVLTARRVARTLTPVQVEVFRGTSRIGINRRGKNKNGQPGILPNPSGPIDEKIWVLKLSRLDGALVALVFSHGCHPVIVYGYDYAGISADFPGMARTALRQKLGQSVHAQFVQGLAGNIRPRVVADIPNNRFRASKPEDVEHAGKELAEDVLAALRTKGEALNLDLAATMDRPFLPRAKPPDRSVYEKMSTTGNKFQQAVARYWLSRYDTGEGFARGDAWPVGLVRLADNQWICYLAGEPCVEWGSKISQWLAPRKLVLWGYSQESISYLPTEELLPEAGYEVINSNYNRATTPAPFAPGIHEAVRRSLLRQVAFIQAEAK